MPKLKNNDICARKESACPQEKKEKNFLKKGKQIMKKEKFFFCAERDGLLFALPAVMGILNVTDNSFFAASRVDDAGLAVERARQMVAAGAAVIDVGACSTRPGADPVSEEEELARLLPTLRALTEAFPSLPLSVDTFRASVVEACTSVCGTFIVNDVSGCSDADMAGIVARHHLPYVLTHNSRTQTSAELPADFDIVQDVRAFFRQKSEYLRAAGADMLILDPGFGFGKTVEENYRLLAHLSELRSVDAPLLVGVSRKSMIQRVLSVSADDALNGTTVLHTLALQKGADILRVHDVREACETVRLLHQLNKSE